MGKSAVGESKEHIQEQPHLQLAQLDLQRPHPKCQLTALLYAVSTSFHLHQGQNLALLEQKANLFKAQTPGFLSPSIVGNSSLQCTGLQDTCGGREKQRWQTAARQSTLQTDVSDTDVSLLPTTENDIKLLWNFIFVKRKHSHWKIIPWALGRNFYTLNWFRTVIHWAIPVPCSL